VVGTRAGLASFLTPDLNDVSSLTWSQTDICSANSHDHMRCSS
jgi:hypothetical protein